MLQVEKNLSAVIEGHEFTEKDVKVITHRKEIENDEPYKYLYVQNYRVDGERISLPNFAIKVPNYDEAPVLTEYPIDYFTNPNAKVGLVVK